MVLKVTRYGVCWTLCEIHSYGQVALPDANEKHKWRLSVHRLADQRITHIAVFVR
jgi:hypothetical protein